VPFLEFKGPLPMRDLKLLVEPDQLVLMQDAVCIENTFKKKFKNPMYSISL
jgi:hypothetical protein